LHAGRTPRPDPTTATVKDACNAFLIHKQALADNGELSPRTWATYKEACDLIVQHFGKARLLTDLAAQDFAGLRAKMAAR
jgi:hypothetical protein